MRAHQKLLQINNWENIQSEVLISTPRRFGKTISVRNHLCDVRGIRSLPRVWLIYPSLLTFRPLSKIGTFRNHVCALWQVSLFAASMIFACAKVEISIYSTCKRISQKLLRNVLRYLAIIHDALKIPRYKTIRENAEELICQGPDGIQDIRVVNPHPKI